MTSALSPNQLATSIYPHYTPPSARSVPAVLKDVAQGRETLREALVELDPTPFKVFRAVFTPSSIATGAAMGAIIGWGTTGHWGSMGLLGALAGTFWDYTPKVLDELPRDIKNVAAQVSNVGIFTLGTLAAYYTLPDSFIQEGSNFVRSGLSYVSSFAHDTTVSPYNFNGVLRGFLKPALWMGGKVYSVAQGTAAMGGFLNLDRLIGSMAVSTIGVESLKALGQTPLFEPLNELIEKYSGNRTELLKQISSIGFVAAGVLYASTFSPINHNPELTSFFASRLSTMYNDTLYNFAFFPVTAFLLAHASYNYSYPPSKSIDPWVDKLTAGIQRGKDEILSKKDELPNLIISGFTNQERTARESIVRAIDNAIAQLRSLIRRDENGYLPQASVRLLIDAASLELLELKISALNDYFLRVPILGAAPLLMIGGNPLRTQIINNMVDTLNLKEETLGNQYNFMIEAARARPEILEQIGEDLKIRDLDLDRLIAKRDTDLALIAHLIDHWNALL